MAVHPFLHTEGSLLYWLRNECKAGDRWDSSYAMLEAFLGFAEDVDPSSFMAYPGVVRHRFYPGEIVWDNPEWLKELFRRVRIQSNYGDRAGIPVTRDVLLDTLLDIAYPVEVRRPHAEAVHAGL